MPELPDVQVFKEYLDATTLHQQIEKVEIHHRDVLGDNSARSLQYRLENKSLESTHRHGKYLFVKVSGDGWSVLHFGMTGFLEYSTTKESPAHTRFLLRFENGAQLAYVCMRMLGLVDWTEKLDRFIQKKELGIDALSDELSLQRFKKLLRLEKG